MDIDCAAIVSINRYHAIGNGGSLLYKIPDDLAKFKKITYGASVIVGRRTYESIANGLPGRDVIVMTRNKEYKIGKNKNVQTATSKEEALLLCKKKHSNKIYVIGGGQIYDLFEDYYSKLYITYIDDFKEGDVFFNIDLWKYIKIKEEAKEYKNLMYYWQEYVIKK